MDVAKPTRPDYSFLAIPDDKTVTLRANSLPISPTLAKGEDLYSRLHFRMDNSVWNVIHDEMMDWHDSNWTSMNLPDNKTCEDIVLKIYPYATKAMLIIVSSTDALSTFLARSGTNKAAE